MPDIPANFITRVDLQRFLLQASGLFEATKRDDLRDGLTAFIAGCAALEGVLGEIPVTPHPVHKALANPNGWKVEWLSCNQSFDHAGKQYAYTVESQYLRPESGSSVFGTGLYRLTADGQTITSRDRGRLLDALAATLADVPDETREFHLSLLFGVRLDDVPPDLRADIALASPETRPI